ncbi:MAG: hypothetical protein ABR514_08550 [Chthoniobacterales bacterium]
MKTESPQERARRRAEQARVRVRQLLWVFFWLLLLEGALRKWVVPRWSDPLLVVRDPVVVLIYFYAIRGRVFPRNGWVLALGVLGFLCLATTFLQLWQYVPPLKIALVAGFGFRADFFQLPLIFIMARVLTPADVKKFGWWTLVFVLPMTLLMVAQFQGSPEAFVNRTAGGGTEMMMSALGKVRTSGTFSFVIGVVAFYALATAYLIWAALRKGVYKLRLLIPAGVALVIGVSVSGSRSVVGACTLVVASLLVIIVLRPDMVNRFGQALIVALFFGLLVSQTPIFREGMHVLSTRFTEAADGMGQSIARGLIARPLDVFEEGFAVISRAPAFGYGLGVGTNAGAKFLIGRSAFLLTEGEWSRILLESGPILGLAFIAWRCALVARVGWLCLRSVRVGNLLPLLLFSAGFLPMLSGQLGQPTILGFAVFVMGLTLAARNEEAHVLKPAPALPPSRFAPAPQRIRRRSVFAERLHDTNARDGQPNGSADR